MLTREINISGTNKTLRFMSQSPGFPSTWAAGAGTARRVPGIGQPVSPRLLFRHLQLSPACSIRSAGRGRRSRDCGGSSWGYTKVLWTWFPFASLCSHASSAELAPVGEGAMPSCLSTRSSGIPPGSMVTRQACCYSLWASISGNDAKV